MNTLTDNKSPIIFQVIDWNCNDVQIGDDTTSDTKKKSLRYQIMIFGRTAEGLSVGVNINDFKPYFYMELPCLLDNDQQKLLLDSIQEQLPKYLQNDLYIEGCEFLEKFKFKGYQWETKSPVIKLVFHSHTAMKKTANMLSSTDKQQMIPSVPFVTFPKTIQLFEVNISPFLRFIHEKDISPSGWIEIPGTKYKRNMGINKEKNTEIDITTKSKYVFSHQKDSIGPIKIASFDIEANSSHGDFPQAKKTYYKLASDLVFTYFDYQKHGKQASVSDIKSWLKYAFQLSTRIQSDVNIQTIYTRQDDLRPVPSEIVLEEIAQKLLKQLIGIPKDDNIKKNKEKLVRKIANNFDKDFPKIEGDQIIQIGTVFWNYGETSSSKKIILTLDTCDPIEDVIVQSFQSEYELLNAWSLLMKREEPDMIVGYNIFGFDYGFIWERAKELGVLENGNFRKMTKIKDLYTKLITQKLVSAGLGENLLYYPELPGTVQIDLLKVVQRDYKLSSYKLDDVATNFIHGDVLSFEFDEDDRTVLESNNLYGLNEGDYLHIFKESCVGEEHVENDAKYKISKLLEVSLQEDKTKKYIVLEGHVPLQKNGTKFKWGSAKDNISVAQIFACQRGTSSDRALVAKYCIQDCVLVINLLFKLDVIPNNIGMANVCYVPLQYIFTRGQGVKTFSLVANECRKEDYIIPYVYKPFVDNSNKDKNNEEDMGDDLEEIPCYDSDSDDSDSDDEEETKEGYEGAIVLNPKPGIYLEDPVSVMDYNSLYPSSMISENLSHNTIILDPEYLGEEGAKRLQDKGIEFEDVTYDNYVYIRKGRTVKKMVNEEHPTVTCRFVQPKRNENGQIIDEERGIVPKILMKLLKARKDTRKKIETETDPFKISVLDGLQLAYKVTANSLYGSIGASVNPLYFKDVAASTTAVGRRMLNKAKTFIESNYPGAEIVYGDTDSIFINFHPKDDEGNPLKGKPALAKSIEMGEDASQKIRQFLRKPHCLEYEKTFYPFILFTKKRYVGNKYTTNADKFKLASMGIVLKRRDNAPILKYIYGQVIDIILNNRSVVESISYLHEMLGRMLNGEFPVDYFVITKCLKTQYKNPEAQVHKALADRIAERDPGNKPQANDRIPYAYIDVGSRQVKLQGERVEHPDFIKQNNLKLDYVFYIQKQISKPVSQIYALVLEQLPGYSRPAGYYEKIAESLKNAGVEDKKAKKKIGDMRVNDVYDLIFKPIVDAEIKRHAEEHSIVLKQKKEIKKSALKVLNVVVETYEKEEKKTTTTRRKKSESDETADVPKKTKKEKLITDYIEKTVEINVDKELNNNMNKDEIIVVREEEPLVKTKKIVRRKKTVGETTTNTSSVETQPEKSITI